MLQSLTGETAHFLFELLAYFVAAQIYLRISRQYAQPAQTDRLLLLGAAIFGAFIGSKLLHIAQHLPALIAENNIAQWLGGKSVLGGLIGGTLGVELAKRIVRWHYSTGDAWVPALAAGLVIGRIGCQLSGVWDQTYGIETNLPWAWNYGDNLGRHPVALYEIILVALLYLACRQSIVPALAATGTRFAMFMLGYCLIRFWLEFLKPPFGAAAEGTLPAVRYIGLSAIQWAAVAGSALYVGLLRLRLSVR
jgi:phosphatidylglycerol---prolipoprotein diacylglyceryl transferase